MTFLRSRVTAKFLNLRWLISRITRQLGACKIDTGSNILLTAHSSQLTAHSSQLTAHSQPPTADSAAVPVFVRYVPNATYTVSCKRFLK